MVKKDVVIRIAQAFGFPRRAIDNASMYHDTAFNRQLKKDMSVRGVDPDNMDYMTCSIILSNNCYAAVQCSDAVYIEKLNLSESCTETDVASLFREISLRNYMLKNYSTTA